MSLVDASMKKQEIKNRVNKFIGNIINNTSFYIEILNIDEVLDKIFPVLDNIYNVVPLEIFFPKLRFIICLYPIKNVCYSIVFNLNVSKPPIPPVLVYETSFLEKDKPITILYDDKLVISLNFAPNFGKKYNTIARQFIPVDVEDLVILEDRTYFSIPLKVSKEEYPI
jgi:hypothetical protein